MTLNLQLGGDEPKASLEQMKISARFPLECTLFTIVTVTAFHIFSGHRLPANASV